MPSSSGGKFKMRLLSYLLVVILEAMSINDVNSAPSPQALNWFKTYENVTTVVTMPLHIQFQTMIMGEVTFKTKDTCFVIKLFPENIVGTYLAVSVHGKGWPKHFANHSDCEDFVYRGILVKPWRYEALVKIVNGELDVTIFAHNDTFVLEPLDRYFNITDTDGIPTSEGTSTYKNIFYKGSDTRMPFNSSYVSFLQNSNRTVSTTMRSKRSVSRTECTLHVVADHTFYAQTGHSSVTTTLAEMVYMVTQADLVFRGTDFDGNGSGDNIGLHINNITIYDNPDSYRMGHVDDVSQYLESFAEYNFENYCLATAFSSKDFDGGVLGLAWVASSNIFGAAGGICQQRIWYNARHLSLNTNLVTNINGGRLIPTYVTVMTLVHEIGHSFGSPHDPVDNAACVPNDEYGNYLMYPYASDADKPNNNVFSSCSINYMYPVIQNKAGCFEDPIAAICGNGIIEAGEECDCGTLSTCQYVDPCCTPGDVSGSDPDLPCTYRRSQGSQCSLVVSTCCTTNCLFMPANENHICRSGTECTHATFCGGMSESCPSESPLPDTTPCAGGRKTCSGGKCIASICASSSREPCTCEGVHSCHVCCASNVSECAPMANMESVFIPRALGVSCNQRQGFCNSDGECVLTDPESVLDRLNQILTSEYVDSVKVWIKTHWYYVLLGVAMLVLLIVIFVLTYRKRDHVQTNAYMYGKFARIQREAEMQKIYMERRRKDMKKMYERKISMLETHTTKEKFTTAIARLMTFFPSVKPDTLIQTLKSSGNEEFAIKWLLIRNYPFRRFCKELDQITEMSTHHQSNVQISQQVNADVNDVEQAVCSTETTV